MSRWIDEALRRYPALEVVRPKFEEMVCRTVELYRNGGTFFVAGNGGSAADADHICGELLKGFKSLRPLPAEELDKWQQRFGEEAREKAAKLQMGLPAVSLLSHPGFISAFGNDVDGSLAFAQQLLALGKKGDIFLGISKQMGFDKAFIAVSDFNPRAKALYQKKGFKPLLLVPDLLKKGIGEWLLMKTL